MFSHTPGRALVALGFFLRATTSFAQTASTSVVQQYTISTSQGTANLQLQNTFSGSVPVGKATPDVLPLSLKDAIEKGLKQNLGLLLSGEGIRSARGQFWGSLSQLLPNLTTTTSFTIEQVNLQAQGFKFRGFPIPPIIGPFGFFDTRARLSQSVLNWRYIEQTRASAQQVRAAKYTYKDARELVVFVVGSTYLQTIADSARVDTALAQRDTARALFQQAEDRFKAGTNARIDALRANVELQTREQQLISARNNLAKQKLALARTIGLPPGQEFTLTDKATYTPLPQPTLDEALQRAYTTRADYQSSLAQLHSAELARKAASAERYPSVSAMADYGDIGVTPGHSHGTVNASATLTLPIFLGGRIHGDVLQAEATLRQSRQQLENLRAQIDQDVRDAFLDLQSAADQVKVAQSNLDLANQTLQQARDRFGAGVADTIEVVQAQESVASANDSLISSLYSYNVAEIELARATGSAEAGIQQYLKGK